MNSNKLFDLVTVLKSFLGQSEDEVKIFIKSPEKLNRNGAELATNHVALALSRSKIRKEKKAVILFSLMQVGGGDFRSCRLILEGVERNYRKLKTADQKAFFREKQIPPDLLQISRSTPQSTTNPNVYPKRNVASMKVCPKKKVTLKTVVKIVKVYCRSKTAVANANLQKMLKAAQAKVTRLKKIASEQRAVYSAAQQQSSRDFETVKVNIHFIVKDTLYI